MRDEQIAQNVRDRVNAGKGPKFREPDCRLSNLVYMGGRQRCYLPSEHQGSCGVPPYAPASGPHWWQRFAAWLRGA